MRFHMARMGGKKCSRFQRKFRNKCCSGGGGGGGKGKNKNKKKIINKIKNNNKKKKSTINVNIKKKITSGNNGGGGGGGSGGEPKCDLCAGGSYPTKPNVVTAVLYIPGNPKCGDLYKMGRQGRIIDTLCKPMRQYFRSPCGCK